VKLYFTIFPAGGNEATKKTTKKKQQQKKQKKKQIENTWPCGLALYYFD